MFDSLRDGAREFFRWWLGELMACLPERLREALKPEGPSIAIVVDGEIARFDLCEGDSIYTLGEIRVDEGDPEQRRAHIDRLFEVADTSSNGVDFFLHGRHVLRPRVDLPLETQANLAEVLAFEMDRYTPFKADEVCFDHRVINVNRAQRRLAVDLAVTRHGEVDRIRRLAQSWGLTLRRIGIEGAAGEGRLPFTLFQTELAETARTVPRRVIGAFGFAAVCLLAVTIYVPVMQKQEGLAASQAELTRVKAEAEEVDALAQEVSAVTAQASYLVNKKRSQPPVIRVLHELTRALPDHTWLVQFGWREGTITFSGFSEKAAALIGDLEQLPMLTDVGFSAPVTADPRVGRERFRITALVTGEAVN